MKTRIMYIESRGDGLIGPARIGRVTFSKSGATIYYAGRSISGVKRNGQDSLYATNVRPTIDADVHDEYWRAIRGLPVPPRHADDVQPVIAADGFAAR